MRRIAVLAAVAGAAGAPVGTVPSVLIASSGSSDINATMASPGFLDKVKGDLQKMLGRAPTEEELTAAKESQAQAVVNAPPQSELATAQSSPNEASKPAEAKTGDAKAVTE